MNFTGLFSQNNGFHLYVGITIVCSYILFTILIVNNTEIKHTALLTIAENALKSHAFSRDCDMRCYLFINYLDIEQFSTLNILISSFSCSIGNNLVFRQLCGNKCIICQFFSPNIFGCIAILSKSDSGVSPQYN